MAKQIIFPRSGGAGKLYKIHNPQSAEEYLETALQAERYLQAHMERTPEGIYWQTTPKGRSGDVFARLSELNLYGGSAGILYFYIKLYQVTREEKYREIAGDALRYLLFRLPAFLPGEVHTLSAWGPGVSLDLGILGLAGIGFVLEEAYRADFWEKNQGDGLREKLRKALKSIGAYYLAHVQRQEGRAFWTGSTTMITDTAILLFLIRYYELEPEEAIRELILSAGAWFLAQGEWQEDGSLFFHGLECIWEGTKLNFEVGVSGSGYLLAKLYAFSKEEAYLRGAEGCAAYLSGQGIAQEKGHLIPFRQDLGKKSPLYLGTCSGPAGTARLFYLLYRLTGNKNYFREIEALVDGIESVGAPEKQSSGLWNNTNLCCGHAGLLQFFVALYQDSGSDRFRDLALRTAAVLLGEKEETEQGGARWTVALERSHPENTSQPLGYYMGAAGIGAALLQLYLSEKQEFYWTRFPDDPFPEGTASFGIV